MSLGSNVNVLLLPCIFFEIPLYLKIRGGLDMDLEKTIQACNYLLKKHNFTMNYTKLIKLLYLADKECLDCTGNTITGDFYFSMPNGPVLSGLLDLIKGKYNDQMAQSLWNSRFMRSGYDLIAATDRIPDSELSPFDEQVLDKLDSKFEKYEFGDMINYVHTNCPEWQDPQGGSIPITTTAILKSLGKTDDEIEWIIEDQKAFDAEEKLFQSLPSEIK
jgi:uncharacterized phage-associated protein